MFLLLFVHLEGKTQLLMHFLGFMCYVVMEEVVGRETEMVLCDPTAVVCLLWGADSFCCSLSHCLDLLAAINRWSPLNIP